MTAAEALNKLVDHLLGENWYSIYMNTEDVYTDIVDTMRGTHQPSGSMSKTACRKNPQTRL